MYEGLARQLIRPHMLVDVDQTALTMFAEALTIYAQVAAQMNEDVPPKYVLPGMHMEVVRNPLVQVRMQAWDRVMKSCVEFGITPSSRSRALMGGIAKQVLDEPADMDDAKFFRKPRVVK
jgi:P27 family predicted phage terminase small subunit